ncbi:hypothetical protein [Micromonospora sp. WMMD737]|uniref:hypothetical protein n=1 Tax=Micromonospora sp. WMMD737 TaxID=3404113 RepID=UPI003B94B0EC
MVGHEGSPLDDLLPTVAALAAHHDDDLGGRADDDLQNPARRAGPDHPEPPDS